jgi:hypothetical protein
MHAHTTMLFCKFVEAHLISSSHYISHQRKANAIGQKHVKATIVTFVGGCIQHNIDFPVYIERTSQYAITSGANPPSHLYSATGMTRGPTPKRGWKSRKGKIVGKPVSFEAPQVERELSTI